MAKTIRTYFDKDNTIIKDSTINLGKNPVVELFYGGSEINPSYSRYIFHFDENYLKQLYNECELNLTKSKHFLKFKPTFFFGDNLQRCLASQYTICLFKINQNWVEGMGYNYGCGDPCDIIGDECNESHSASNWFYATPIDRWVTEGVFDSLSGETEYLQCLNVGDENCEYISFDVTNIVNDIISGETVNYGFGIALHNNFELFPSGEPKYLGFYSKDTDTFYEPFLETTCEVNILDDRLNFIENEDNTLYLMVKQKGKGVILDELPVITILSPSDEQLLVTTGECVGAGLYSITINLSGETCGLFSDVWSNLYYNGKKIIDVVQEFEIKENNLILFNQIQETQYAFKARGINRGEKIMSGETRRLFVDVYEKYNPNKKQFVEVYYRVYKKEGCLEHNIIDWSIMNRLGCDNFIDLETFWMIKGQYFIDFKVNSNGVERSYPEEFFFEVLNQNCC